jgi:hypothetical protein
VVESSAATISFSGPHDPSLADAAAGFHYSYALTAGSLAASYSAAADPATRQFTFGDDGTYTVFGRIFDKDNGYTDYQTTVTVTPVIGPGDVTPPSADIADVTPDPRSTPVASIQIVFSEAVTGLDLADLSLRRNGGSNLLTSAQTLTTSDGVAWTLGNLTGLAGVSGNYSLELKAAESGIRDLAGNDLAGPASDAFVIVTGYPWRNSSNHLDVNGDTLITPLDVLLVINYLNRSGAGALTVPPPSPGGPPPFLDTNSDDFVTPLDALLVINFINQRGAAAGEFAPAMPVPVAGLTAVDAGLQLESAPFDIDSRSTCRTSCGS